MKDSNRFLQPSFGKISASRVQTTGANLFASNVTHGTYIVLEIKRAELERSGTHDFIFGNEGIVRVALSPVQWAEFLTNMNTDGVPCTIQWTEKDGRLEYRPIADRMNETYKHATQKISNHAKDHIAPIIKEIEESNLSKKKKEEIIRSLKSAYQHLDGNAKFYLNEFEDQAKRIVAESKSEAEAAKQHVVETLGWDAIKESKLLSNGTK